MTSKEELRNALAKLCNNLSNKELDIIVDFIFEDRKRITQPLINYIDKFPTMFEKFRKPEVSKAIEKTIKESGVGNGQIYFNY